MTDKQRDALNKLQEDERLFVGADDIAPILEANPQTIRSQAQANVSALGFPASVTGKIVRIPRIPFLRWMGEAQ